MTQMCSPHEHLSKILEMDSLFLNWTNLRHLHHKYMIYQQIACYIDISIYDEYPRCDDRSYKIHNCTTNCACCVMLIHLTGMVPAQCYLHMCAHVRGAEREEVLQYIVQRMNTNKHDLLQCMESITIFHIQILTHFS